jgi:hypothetical protein
MERPTQQQIKNFVNFIFQDHSWGKHLTTKHKFYIMMVEGCHDLKPIDEHKDEEYKTIRIQRYKKLYGSLYYLCDLYVDVDTKVKELFTDENTVKFILDNYIEMDRTDYYHNSEIYKKFLQYTQKVVEHFFPENPEK